MVKPGGHNHPHSWLICPVPDQFGQSVAQLVWCPEPCLYTNHYKVNHHISRPRVHSTTSLTWWVVQLNKECLHCIKSLEFSTGIVVYVLLEETFPFL